MRRRWGLRAKMTGSYVLVTVAAVVLVETVLIGVAWLSTSGTADPADRDPGPFAAAAAADYAGRVAARAAQLGRLPGPGELRLGDPSVQLAPGEARLSKTGAHLVIPYTTRPQSDSQPMSMALLLSTDSRIAVSSYPARYRVGDRFDLPQNPRSGKLDQARLVKGSELFTNHSGDVYWVTAPVLDYRNPADSYTEPAVLGTVYVQVPAATRLAKPGARLATQSSVADVLLPQLGVGLLVLLAVLAGSMPVGAVFGLLSTRRLVGRLRRLANSTVAVAEGDFHHRVPVSGGDEVGKLEQNFNRMAERLAGAMEAERRLAGADERGRIARELHDSISQDLFSMRLLAGGLRRALPAGSPLRGQVETMEETADETLHEMRALLMELRPVALAEAGLLAALDELCRAYRDRLGVAVDTELAPVELAAPGEHAVLRVAQEALANAVKHARPHRIALRLRPEDGQVLLSVEDDGVGFDPARAGERHGLGLGLMRERVTELGGEFELRSAPGDGTRVLVRLPGRQP